MVGGKDGAESKQNEAMIELFLHQNVKVQVQVRNKESSHKKNNVS